MSDFHRKVAQVFRALAQQPLQTKEAAAPEPAKSTEVDPQLNALSQTYQQISGQTLDEELRTKIASDPVLLTLLSAQITAPTSLGSADSDDTLTTQKPAYTTPDMSIKEAGEKFAFELLTLTGAGQ